MNISLIPTLIFAAALGIEPAKPAQTEKLETIVSEFRIIDTAVVVADPQNVISISDSVHAFGLYKYSLNGALTGQSPQSSDHTPPFFVVEHIPTGQIGLTSGVVIIKHQPWANPQAIAAEHGLTITSELSSINRFAIRLDSIADLSFVRENLLSDIRILLVELDVSYAPLCVQ